MKPGKTANTILHKTTFETKVTVHKLNATKPEHVDNIAMRVDVWWATMATSEFALEA